MLSEGDPAESGGRLETEAEQKGCKVNPGRVNPGG